NSDKEHDHASQDTKPIPITIVRPIAKPDLEVKLIESSSRPQPTENVIDITPHEQSILEEQPESPYRTLKPDRGNEERLEKAAREARLMQLSKPELIKVATKVATKAGVDPKALQSSKGGHEFLKKQDDELNVLNREHLENLKKEKSSKGKGLISIDRLSIVDSSLRRSLTSTFIQTQNQLQSLSKGTMTNGTLMFTNLSDLEIFV
nr:hypothetical protein [Tanacetum cinerariifolium]